MIIVIAIMAILIGVVALAVLPNIQRSRESKDIQALDSIASAANAAIATTQVTDTGDQIFSIAATSAGCTAAAKKTGTGDTDKVCNAIIDTVADGAGKCESDATDGATIYVGYNITTKKVAVAYCIAAPASLADFNDTTGTKVVKCKYLDDTFAVTN